MIKLHMNNLIWMFVFFFFQAEDGIRYWSVTGVQTCALPIFEHLAEPDVHEARKRLKEARALLRLVAPALGGGARAEVMALRDAARQLSAAREIGRASCRGRV